MSLRIAGVWVMLCSALLPCCVGAQSDRTSQATEPPQVVQNEGDIPAKDAADRQDAGKAEESAQADEPSEAKKPAENEEPSELDLLKMELEKLRTEHDLLVQRQQNTLVEGELEQQRIAAQTALRKAREEEKLAVIQAEAGQLDAKAALRKAKLEEELAAVQAELARLEAETTLQETRHKKEIGELQAQVERQSAAGRLDELKAAEAIAAMKAEANRLSAENAVQEEKHRMVLAEATLANSELAAEVEKLKTRLGVRDAQDELDDRVLGDIDYRTNPVIDGTLYVSDRRIQLNGPIVSGTADYVAERIHYFNNRSRELPIFVVIDYCPGGSVMQGYRIVKAIESSPAPVYVVVKSFAASMAAVITTLADHSYAYPNAIILHHQMSGGMYGNLTQQAEQLENAKEWARRLSEPVSKKMGISPEKFVALMYEHNSDGDWEEFADKAKELKWVNEIIHEIREEGVRKRPEGDTSQPIIFFWQQEEVDSDGQRFVRLPKLQPFDHYFLYDPDHYYR